MRDVWFRLIGEPYELCYHLKLFEIFDKFGIHLLEENYVDNYSINGRKIGLLG